MIASAICAMACTTPSPRGATPRGAGEAPGATKTAVVIPELGVELPGITGVVAQPAAKGRYVIAIAGKLDPRIELHLNTISDPQTLEDAVQDDDRIIEKKQTDDGWYWVSQDKDTLVTFHMIQVRRATRTFTCDFTITEDLEAADAITSACLSMEAK